MIIPGYSAVRWVSALALERSPIDLALLGKKKTR